MNPNPKATFGKTIRELRQKQELSQSQLAMRSGMHRNYVGSVERGERNLSLLNIHALARALRTRPAKLFKGEE
jgi:transcriptional regulator with XRE-family HTH domain